MGYRVGDVLDGYELETECGSGAFGSVFLAKNRTLGQTCALKILYKNGRQYEKELEGLKTYQQKCRHANLMRVDHVGENDECIFYTMDAADNLHPGKKYIADTLGNRLKEKSRLSPDEIIPMLHDLLDGLDALHSAGILHRDIKPDNILWVNGHAMLGDIGLISNKLEASMAGTPGFISPRVWSNHAFTPQDDLYALAMVMYCALNGAPPENYPIPGSMPLTDSAQLIIRVYNEVLKPDSAIKTVKEFQALFLNPPKRKVRKQPLIVAAVVIAALGAGLFFFFMQKPAPEAKSIQPQIPSETARQAETVKPEPPPSRKAVKPEPAPQPKPVKQEPVKPQIVKMESVPIQKPVKSEPVVKPKPVPSPKTVKSKPAPLPQPIKPKPQIVKDIRILPGTIYELHLPPLSPEGTSREVLIEDGLRVQIIYAGKMAEIRKRYAEDSRLAAEIPVIEQQFEVADGMWGFKNGGTHLTLSPATEALYRMRTTRRPVSWADFEKAHQEQYRKSLEFLKRYPPEEQARILYYAARRDERSFSVIVRQGVPDMPANREIWERNYKAWTEYHARMLKARNNLLSFR